MYPKVGICIAVIQEGKILLGKRKGAHGEGQWATPGGHLEFKESVEECAARELLEETGLKAKCFEQGPWMNHILGEKHYVTLVVFVDEFEGSLQNLEPEKCEGWEWFDLKSLPQPLFPTVTNIYSSVPLNMRIATPK